MIIKGISWGRNLRVTDHAFAVIRAQGGVIEEPTTPEEAPLPELPSEELSSSFAEKEKVVVDIPAGPEPIVGSVTSVDLRARKEGFVEPDSRSTGSDSSDDVLA